MAGVNTTVHDVRELWREFVPSYRGFSYAPFIVKLHRWDPALAATVRGFSARRSESRIANYLDPAEIERVRRKLDAKPDASIRFGVSKDGAGYHGERGDFCLVAGCITRRAHLTLFHRRLELIGGLAYDLVLIEELGRRLDIRWRSVTLMAREARAFARRGNSNEKLYSKLQPLLKE